MTRIPENLTTISDVWLEVLDRALERDLKREIDRVSAKDLKFARTLKNALLVEDEVNRRQEPSA